MANCHLNLLTIVAVICVLCTTAHCGKGWRSDIELFDLVERINQNFYTMLNVEQNATTSEIKRAYRKLSKQYHPDRSKNEDTTQTFQDLALVAEVLTNRQKRKRYDIILEEGLPDWKEPVFYYRRVKKMSMTEFIIILFILSTVGHAAYLWSVYLGKQIDKYLSEPTMKNKERKQKQKAKLGYENRLAPVTFRPQTTDYLPVILFRFVKATYHSWPYCKDYILSKLRSSRDQTEQDQLTEDTRRKERKQKNKRRNIVKTEETHSNGSMKSDETSWQEQTQPNIQLAARTGNELATSNECIKKEWTANDQVVLARLMDKYPGGIPERWVKISREMHRSVAQVTSMAKLYKSELSKGKLRFAEDTLDSLIGNNTENNDESQDDKLSNNCDTNKQVAGNWSQDQQNKLQKALQKYSEQTVDRWKHISDMVPSKTKAECISRYIQLCQEVKKRKVASVSDNANTK